MQVVPAPLQGFFRLFQFTDITEDKHNTHNLPIFIIDRSGAVLNRDFSAISSLQIDIFRKPNDLLLVHGDTDRINWCDLAITFAIDITDLSQLFAKGIIFFQAERSLGNRVHKNNPALRISCDNTVSDTLHCRKEPRFPLFHAANQLCFQKSYLND